MKTININLIGEFARTVKSSGIELQEDNLDSRTKILVIAFIIGTLIILAVSFGLWLGANSLSVKAETNLKQLKAEFSKLQKEENELSKYTKELKQKKEIAELKLLAKEQINDMFIPWSEILSDLSTKIPKKVIVTNIKKNYIRGGTGNMSLLGIVSAEDKPLTEVSFLILNINEDKNCLLTNAEIKNLEYDKESELYEFEIQADLTKARAGKDNG